MNFKTSDFGVLNFSLDIAIAGAVTEYQRQRNEENSRQEVEHMGILVHEIRNALSSVIMARDLIRSGKVGFSGRTADVLDRNLFRMRDLIDKELGDVRLRVDAQPHLEFLRLAELMDEIGATMQYEAASRGQEFSIEVDHELEFKTDQQLFVSLLSNLILNAIKYTPSGGRVLVRGYLQNSVVASSKSKMSAAG